MTFSQIWEIIGEEAILSYDKSKLVYEHLLKVTGVPGAICEVGVYQGRTAKLMRLTLPMKKLHLYDTFEGIRGADVAKDVHVDGEFSASLDLVSEFVGHDKTFYHVGLFPDSFNEDTPFAFVHSDTDTYFGTKATLETLLPRLSVGGIMIFDDYDWSYCPGVRTAIEEYLPSSPFRIHTRAQGYQFIVMRLE